MPKVARHWGGNNSAANDPLRTPGNTLLYLYLPPIRLSGHGDYYFPINRGTLLEKTRNKKLPKAGHCGTEVPA
jgi:hypothetical protein